MTIGKHQLGLLTLAAALLAGCGKTNDTPPGVSIQAIDATHLGPAFASATPELKKQADDVMMSIQGSDFAKAAAGLDALANAPGLSEPQKKAVSDLSAQVKKKLAAPAAPPAQ